MLQGANRACCSAKCDPRHNEWVRGKRVCTEIGGFVLDLEHGEQLPEWEPSKARERMIIEVEPIDKTGSLAQVNDRFLHVLLDKDCASMARLLCVGWGSETRPNCRNVARGDRAPVNRGCSRWISSWPCLRRLLDVYNDKTP